MVLVEAFAFKQQHIIPSLIIRIPVIGKYLGMIFIKPIREMYKACEIRDKYLDKMIGEKRRELQLGLENSDLVTILLKSTDSKNIRAFSHDQIRAQLFTFLFAGFDTTSVSIVSILFHLGNEPEWVDKICEEFEVGKLTVTIELKFNC